jgi:tetratricopeptide (TPR) repeat protein
MNRLTGEACGLLRDAIVGAFTHDEFRELTFISVGINLDQVVGNGPFADVTFKFVQHCEQHGLTAKLIEAVIRKRSHLHDSLVPIATSLTPTPVIGRGLFQLPTRLQDFTGREDELARITTRLRNASLAVVSSELRGTGGSSALRGMGGIGKTKTAVEAGWRVKDHFPDAQLFIELRGMSERPMTAGEAMARVIRDFHPETGKLPDDEAELHALYRSVLAGKRVLILLDDSRDKAQVKRLLEVDPPVAFVITSRNGLAFDGVALIRLDILPQSEALSFLRGLVGAEKGTDPELSEVAELCGRLPLALRVAGDFLRLRENWSLPKYIAALKDESNRLERLKDETPDRDVKAVLGLSARELVRENAERADRWQMLSVFPADFETQAAAAVWGLKSDNKFDADSAQDELTALLDRNLVQYDKDTDRYELHDLMRPIAREAFEFVDGHPMQASAAGRLVTAEQRFADFYCRVLATANALYLKGNANIGRGLALFDREQGNIRHGQSWAVNHRCSDQIASALCRDYPRHGASTVHLRLPPRTRISWLDEALLACRDLKDRQGESEVLSGLGIAWDQLGEACKAIAFHEQHLVIARELGDQKGVSAALGHLGMAWAALGDVRKAITFYEQHLVIAREIGNRRWEESALGNLGRAWTTLGEMDKAIAFLNQARDIARELGNKQGESLALLNLGVVSGKSGNPQAAIPFLEQGLALACEIGDRRIENSALGNLGHAHRDREDLQKAIDYYEQALAGEREIGNRRDEATTAFNLAAILYRLGRKEEAIRLAKHALTIFTAIESPWAEKVREKLAEWRDNVPS